MTRLLTLLLVLAAVPVAAQGSLDAGRALLDDATRTESVDSLRQARAVLGVAAAGDDAAAASWAAYYQAVADYRLAYALWGGDADAALGHAEAGAALARRLADDASQPDALRAEAHALLATLLGAQIGLDPSRGMALGERTASATAASLRLAPDSPRVLLLSAASLLSTPPEWGGDPALAVRQLEEAAASFARPAGGDATGRDAAGPHAPGWGEGDVHAWLALAHLMAGDPDAARPHVAEAARLTPGSSFVQYKLQPWLAQLDAAR